MPGELVHVLYQLTSVFAAAVPHTPHQTEYARRQLCPEWPQAQLGSARPAGRFGSRPSSPGSRTVVTVPRICEPIVLIPQKGGAWTPEASKGSAPASETILVLQVNRSLS